MFYKKVNYKSNKNCYEFIKNHFTYYTLSSWNGLRSIANKVKLYDLDLKNDWLDVLDALEDDDYLNINFIIKEWEKAHDGYSVGFNGRSGGYLVLYKKDSVNNCLYPDINPLNYETYEDFKEDVTNYWGLMRDYHNTLIKQVKLIQEFDKLCDDLVEYCDALTDDFLEFGSVRQ